MTARDTDRIDRTTAALRAAGVDALVGALPSTVLMLTGYWPVIGRSVAVVTRDGAVAVAAPGDEVVLARLGWADCIETFGTSGPADATPQVELVGAALRRVGAALGLSHGVVLAAETQAAVEPATYVATHRYASLDALLPSLAPGARQVPADALLTPLRAVLTAAEVERLRQSCRAARAGFEGGVQALNAGVSEIEAAAWFALPLRIEAGRLEDGRRSAAAVYCMSGPRSADAGGHFARSTAAPFASGDLVLVHCNACVGGFWTDITRTWTLGVPDRRQAAMFAAIADARQAALAALRPGVTAGDVDEAAREVLRARGFGDAFRHGLGHAVGFSAIDADALPRLRPGSTDVLREGMAFNIEPAIYLDGIGGARHCDDVVLTAHGAEVLTPFQPAGSPLPAAA